MPGLSGYDLCRRVRSGDAVTDPWDPDVPIIILSAKAEHTDRVRGLERGADDYITKPFHYPELLARIGGLLRRVSRADKRTQFRIEELVVDTLAKRVTVGGHTVALSVKEFQLLATLAANPEKVFSKRELLEQVWDFKSHGRTRTGEGGIPSVALRTCPEARTALAGQRAQEFVDRGEAQDERAHRR
jgi:two-component system, OmpR family, alkaline phosphatase synthesis response regulator PhoP